MIDDLSGEHTCNEGLAELQEVCEGRMPFSPQPSCNVSSTPTQKDNSNGT